MGKQNDSALFFTCSLIEQLGRMRLLKRAEVVSALGMGGISVIYNHADVLHCEPIEKVADDFTEEFSLPSGTFDNMASARFSVPDVWTIGKVYARLIEDVSQGKNVPEACMEVYTSWISDKLSDYNSSFYYESREYLAECFRQGEILDG